jgi:HD-like signal output (HDOD) protein
MTEIELIINQFILEDGKIYTLPELYHQLDEKIRSETATIESIGELLSTDAALTAKILRIANSPLYGFKSEITTLNRALNLIGLKIVKNIILMDTVAQNFNKNDKYTSIQMQDFWRRSVYIALIAKKIANRINHDEPDRLFICGIMSRIGQLVAILTRAKESLIIHHQCQNDPEENQLNIERNVLGFTFNELSAQLLKHWKVPEEIYYPILALSDPLNSTPPSDNYTLDGYIMNVATIYSQKLGLDNVEQAMELIPTSDFVASIERPINKALNIDESGVDDILFEIEIEAIEILAIVFPKATTIY